MGVKQAIKILNQRKEEEQQRQIAPIKTENPRGAIANEFKNFMMQTANNINNTTRNSIETLKSRQNQTTEQDNKRLIAPVGNIENKMKNKYAGLTGQPIAPTKDDVTLSEDDIKELAKKHNKTDIVTNQRTAESLQKAIEDKEQKEKIQRTEDTPIYDTGTKVKRNRKGEWKIKDKVFKEPEAMTDLKDRIKKSGIDGLTFDEFKDNVVDAFDTTKYILEDSAAHGLGNVFKGIAGIGEGIDDVSHYGFAQLVKLAGNIGNNQELKDWADEIEYDTSKTGKWLQWLEEKTNDAKADSVFGNKSERVAEGVGSTIPTMVVDLLATGGTGTIAKIGKAAGLGLMGMSSAGSSLSESYQTRGKLDGLAWIKAGIDGGTSIFVEQSGGMLGNGLSYDTKIANELTKNLKPSFKNSVISIGTRLGLSSIAEGNEEVIEAVTNTTVNKFANGFLDLVGDKGERYDSNLSIQEIVDNFTYGTIASLITQGGAKITQIGGNAVVNNETFNESVKQLAKAENISGQLEEKEAILDKYEKELNKSKTSEERTKIEEKIEKTKQEIESLQANETEKDIKELLNERIDNNKIEQARESRMLAPVFKTEQQKNNLNIPQVEQTTRATAEVYKNAFKSDADRERIVTQLEAIQNTRNKYNKNGTLNIVFDSTVNGNGVLISDKQGNRTIKLNPKTDKAAEFVLIHELTHDLKGSDAFTELSELVQSFNNKQFNFENALESIKNTYEEFYKRNNLDMSDLDTKEEAMADILGTALGNQEFVKQLAQKPTLFQKIKNWISKQIAIHKSSDKEFTRWLYNVQDTFKKAIKENSNVNGTKYSIQTDNKGNKYVKVDTDQNIFEGKSPKEYTKIAKEYILRKFRDGNKKINLPTKEELNITSKTANEYTYPKNKLPYKESNSKMKASTELDNIVKISEYKYSAPDDGRHKFAKDGWDYYKTVFEVDGIKFEGLVNIAKDGNKKTLYDITQIKKLPHYSTSDKSFSVSLRSASNNSITPTEAEVNTTNSNSTQENKKYSQEFKDKWKEYLDFIDKKVTETKGKQEKTYFNKEFDINRIPFESNKINKFNGYSEREIKNIESDKITIAKSKEDINNFVTNAREKSSNIRMFLSKISNKVAKKINKNLGIDVTNYNISLKNDDVRKIFKDHGNEKTEISRGQVPITVEDFQNIPDIINNYDSVAISGKSPQGKIALKFEKNINGNNVVVTYISDKHKNLEMQTMYKFKNDKKNNSVTALYENKAPRLNTSEMDSDTSINNIIPHSNDKMQEARVPTKNSLDSLGNDLDKQEKILTPIGDKNVRKHYKSIIESEMMTDEARKISKELMGTDTYVPETNEGQLKIADERIKNSGPDAELKSLGARVIAGETLKSTDIAVGERLIQYYSKIGDSQNLAEAIRTTAMAGTQAGQTVQALSLLNHQTPEGQAIWLSRSVDKFNNELAKKKGGTIIRSEEGTIRVETKQGKDITNKVKLFDLTSEMQEKIINSKDKTELNKNLDEVYKELGKQVPKTFWEQVDAWRYFSMLGNPRTHIRNIFGNVAMGKVQSAKNRVAGTIEYVVNKVNSEFERTKTITGLEGKAIKDFAKNDIVNVYDRLGLTEGKMKPKTRLENSRQTYKSNFANNTIGALMNFNDFALEAEDGWGLKAAYIKSLGDYMSANKLNPDTITDNQLSKARNYAVEQAKEATFHQDSELATLINQFSRKNKLTKFAADTMLPFVKTPINVAKSAFEYSPAGLVKSIAIDTTNVYKGKISGTKFIDNISKGLTGTGIAVVGYALAKAGVLKANGSDEDKEKYDEAKGKQPFSINIFDKNISLEWLAPTAIPLFVGAEIAELQEAKKQEGNDDKKTLVSSIIEVSDALTKSMNPMTEMSMLSGLTSALSSYQNDSSQILSGILVNSSQSYVNQFFPTLGGQIAKTFDPYERSTTSTKKGGEKIIDTTKNQIMNKLPGVRKMLPTKSDIWGNTVKQDENLLVRGFNSFINPATVKTVSNTKVDKAIEELYADTGDRSLFPTTINKELTIKDSKTNESRKYTMSNEEYSEFKKQYSKATYDMLDELVQSDDYNMMQDYAKQYAINTIYDYAKEKVKVDYANKHKIDYEANDLYKSFNNINDKIGYTSFRANTGYMESDKDEKGDTIDGYKKTKQMEWLLNSELSENTKQYILENDFSSDSYKYQLKDLNNVTNDYDTLLYFNNLSKDGKKDYIWMAKQGVNQEKYIRYSNKMSEASESAKKKGEDFGKAEKAKILADSKMSKKDKKLIYETKLKAEEDLVYDALGDIDIDVYLDYLQQDFSSDKVEDGTLDGKTVSGSSKQKVYNYINSMNTSYENKLILIGLKYKLTDTERNKLAQYINTLSLSKKDKLELYNKMKNTQGFKVYKDGRVTW